MAPILEGLDMIALFRWVLMGFLVICAASLLYPRGGLGEYLRGGSLTTASLSDCVDDMWQEVSHISCKGTWNLGDGEVRGTVREVSPHSPATLRVFAAGTTAHPADTRLMMTGAGVLVALAGLLGWEAVALIRRSYGAAGTRRGAFSSSRA
nr:hypothetical protein GCM10020063_044870 [Dactylosporangium thailandense]